MIDNLFLFLNQGWVGIVIGLALAIYQFLKKSHPKPVYQYFGQKLISSEGGIVDNEITVIFNNTNVPRISLTYIIFWNRGKTAIKRDDIADGDPLSIRIDEGEILKAEIIRSSRDAISASISFNDTDRTTVFPTFDFLDEGDGFAIKILHTSADTKPKLNGTIIGAPHGIKSLGRAANIPSQRSYENFSAKALSFFRPNIALATIIALLGIAMILNAVFPDIPPFNPPSFLESKESKKTFLRIFLAISGSLYLSLAATIARRVWRRFPMTLGIDEDFKR